jgi:threonine dehydrogenase-like Zn-dependent dehydrogenase
LSFIGERSQGCFAEYISVKQKDLVKISKTKEIKSLALAEPFAVALNICNRAHFKTDDKLAIIGAGPIGLLVIKAAKEIYGVENITAIDLSDERLKIALQMGARTTSKKLSGKEKFNKIVECAGVEQTFKNALENVEANGNVYVVSIFEKDFEFDINKLVSKQISIIGCNVYTKKNLIDSVNLISNKKVYIDKLVSKVFNLEDVNKAFDLLNSENKSVAKVLFKIK